MKCTNALFRIAGILALMLFGASLLDAQIGISSSNTPPDSCAMLDIMSGSKGLLIPRMTTAGRMAIPSPKEGLLVYDSTLHHFFVYRKGFTEWMPLNVSADALWTYDTITHRTYLLNDTSNVGIGIHLPGEKLTVNGKIRGNKGIIANSPGSLNFKLLANGQLVPGLSRDPLNGWSDLMPPQSKSIAGTLAGHDSVAMAVPQTNQMFALAQPYSGDSLDFEIWIYQETEGLLLGLIDFSQGMDKPTFVAMVGPDMNSDNNSGQGSSLYAIYTTISGSQRVKQLQPINSTALASWNHYRITWKKNSYFRLWINGGEAANLPGSDVTPQYLVIGAFGTLYFDAPGLSTGGYVAGTNLGSEKSEGRIGVFDAIYAKNWPSYSSGYVPISGGKMTGFLTIQSPFRTDGNWCSSEFYIQTGDQNNNPLGILSLKSHTTGSSGNYYSSQDIYATDNLSVTSQKGNIEFRLDSVTSSGFPLSRIDLTGVNADPSKLQTGLFLNLINSDTTDHKVSLWTQKVGDTTFQTTLESNDRLFISPMDKDVIISPYGAAKVGIGMFSTSEKLSVNGNIFLNSAMAPPTNITNVLYNVNGQLYFNGTLLGGSGLPPGGPGQTLRYDGSAWVANAVIYNDGDFVGIGSSVPEAKLDVNGAIKINTTSSGVQGVIRYTGTDFEGYTPAGWTSLTSTGNSWDLQGNSGTNPATNYLGTSDGQPLIIKVNNAISGWLSPNPVNESTGFGYQSLSNHNLAGNSAFGTNALGNLTTGTQNTALGRYALSHNQSGNYNVAVGNMAAMYLASGDSNIAIGNLALSQPSAARGNTIIGTASGRENSGNDNVFVGVASGNINETGSGNVGIGGFSLSYNTTGSNITTIGYRADVEQLDLVNATAIGFASHVGSSNSLVLGGVGVNSVNVGIGTSLPKTNLQIYSPNTTLSTLLINHSGTGDVLTRGLKIYMDGSDAGLKNQENGNMVLNVNNSTNQIVLLSSGFVGIGTSTTHSEFTVAGTITPGEDNTGTLGTSGYRWQEIFCTNGVINTSDRRLKTNILSLDKGLDVIMKLKPVSFEWKKDQDKTHFGLIAQDVDVVIPHATYSVVNEGTDPDKTMGINYNEIVPVLIKAVQELKRENDALKAEIGLLKEKISK
ncbi:MAG TPA: tail fiber domain-containing protein [Bacteroidales bacterium]|nr:tail fiber domain-containing protein [Bacteroidales bacterium]